jgi:hypothetical protein
MGINFFPNDPQNHALIASSSCCIIIYRFTNATAGTLIGKFPYDSYDFRHILISPAGDTALSCIFTANLIAYFSVSYTSVSLIQALSTSSYCTHPESALYVNETLAFAYIANCGFYQYVLTSSSITYDRQLSTAGYAYGPTFMVGSRAQGLFANTNNDYFEQFYYNANTLTVGATFAYFGATPNIALTNTPYSRLVLLGNSYIKLYAACNANACASGGCDLNGICIGGCAPSTPARNGTNCTCPSGYIDDGVNA